MATKKKKNKKKARARGEGPTFWHHKTIKPRPNAVRSERGVRFGREAMFFFRGGMKRQWQRCGGPPWWTGRGGGGSPEISTMTTTMVGGAPGNRRGKGGIADASLPPLSRAPSSGGCSPRRDSLSPWLSISFPLHTPRVRLTRAQPSLSLSRLPPRSSLLQFNAGFKNKSLWRRHTQA